MKFKHMLAVVGIFISWIFIILIYSFSYGITTAYLDSNEASKEIQIDDMYIKFDVPIQEYVYKKRLIEDLSKNIEAEGVRIYNFDIENYDHLIIAATFCRFDEAKEYNEVIKLLKNCGIVYNDLEKISEYRDKEGNNWEVHGIDETTAGRLYTTSKYAIYIKKNVVYGRYEANYTQDTFKEWIGEINVVDGCPSIKKMKDGYIRIGNARCKTKKIKDKPELKSIEALGTKVVFEYPMNMKYTYGEDLSEHGYGKSISDNTYIRAAYINNSTVLIALTDMEINNKYDLDEFLKETQLLMFNDGTDISQVYHETDTHIDDEGTEWTTYNLGIIDDFNYNILIQVGKDTYGSTHIVCIMDTLHTPKINIEDTSSLEDLNRFRIGDKIL